MDHRRLAVRVSDVERVLDKYQSPILGSNFRATLPAGRAIRLLISLQGQDVVSLPALESTAYSLAHINSYELHKAYLPLFSEWGFVRIYENKIEETVKSRIDVLERAGKWWEQSNPHQVEELGVELFDRAAMAPVASDSAEKILQKFDKNVCDNTMTHLSQSNLVDRFKYKDSEWLYSPEIFGENYPKTVKYLQSQTQAEREEVFSIVEKVMEDQGIPHDTLKKKAKENIISQMAGAGLILGYPISFEGAVYPFYFTPDIRNRFDNEGRGEKFDLIKSGISHFQFAHRLAEQATGKLSFNPSVFLDRLLENGRAGDATAIGTDYELLVKTGLVKIEPTHGTQYRFLLPASKEKIADLEAIRDAFKEKWIVPKIDLSAMGIPNTVVPGDSIVYMSSKLIQGKELAREYAHEVFKL
jgi:hypothetical protein